MKISLVTGATYFPQRISGNQKIQPEPKPQGSVNIKNPAKAEGPLLDGLTPREVSALQKLFGDFKVEEKGAILNTVRPGQFVDITI